MSDIPDTENSKVAAIAAALEIAKYKRTPEDKEDFFPAALDRFLEAYDAIIEKTSK